MAGPVHGIPSYSIMNYHQFLPDFYLQNSVVSVSCDNGHNPFMSRSNILDFIWNTIVLVRKWAWKCVYLWVVICMTCHYAVGIHKIIIIDAVGEVVVGVVVTVYGECQQRVNHSVQTECHLGRPDLCYSQLLHQKRNNLMKPWTHSHHHCHNHPKRTGSYLW